MQSIDPEGMYLVIWPDGSKRLLFGQRIICMPVGSSAKVIRLKEAQHDHH